MASIFGENQPSNLAQKIFEKGLALHQSGQLTPAQELYRQALGLQSNHYEALHLLGVLNAQQKNYSQAIDLIGRSLKINPDNVAAYGNLGNTYKEMGRYEAAVECYDQVMVRDPGYANIAANRDHALRELKQSIGTSGVADSYFRRGVRLSAARQFQAAIESYDNAIVARPDFAAAYFNRGNALNELEMRHAAIESYDRAIALNPDSELWQCVRLATKIHVCDWSVPRSRILELVQNIQRNGKAFFPFQVLALSGSPSIQRQAAESWIATRFPASLESGSVSKRSASRKIRIGYFSMDFCIHPVSLLTVELFETHDRDKFEVYAFSFGPDTKDKMRRRLEGAFDEFIDVSDKSDQEIAAMARALEIDIAVDLAGLTGASRTGIFALRAACLQVNYIGYPGTMGAGYMDYLIADNTLIPETSRHHYTEKIVYLPSFQANDSKRQMSDKVLTREDFGLPESGFVFCCFNNNYKITPGVFDSWMRILLSVKGSVLFLYEENELVATNLAKEAACRGVDENRLVFAKRVAVSEYLARYRVADLFLDTLPFNAGATASDALWAGLPVLTCQGEAFASRMASSLLMAVGLPELITRTQEDYERLAIDLATDPEQLKAIKEKLRRNRLSSLLFDTKLFTRNIEGAYTKMVERYRSGLPPDHIYVM
jgi:predicted O-linked N-acetylglucosamine transferase (SPINDLY family)